MVCGNIQEKPNANAKLQMVHMRFDPELLKRVEDFQLANRFETRTETERWLIHAALDKKLKPAKKGES